LEKRKKVVKLGRIESESRSRTARKSEKNCREDGSQGGWDI
jgi:hypothetical protein